LTLDSVFDEEISSKQSVEDNLSISLGGSMFFSSSISNSFVSERLALALGFENEDSLLSANSLINLLEALSLDKLTIDSSITFNPKLDYEIQNSAAEGEKNETFITDYNQKINQLLNDLTQADENKLIPQLSLNDNLCELTNDKTIEINALVCIPYHLAPLILPAGINSQYNIVVQGKILASSARVNAELLTISAPPVLVAKGSNEFVSNSNSQTIISMRNLYSSVLNVSNRYILRIYLTVDNLVADQKFYLVAVDNNVKDVIFGSGYIDLTPFL
jgi:hypothetical protein